MPSIDLNLTGRGLTFSDNQLVLDFDPSSNVEVREDGIFLAGITNPGTAQTKIDDWSIVEYNGSGTIKTNKDVVQYIYAFSKYPVIESSREGMSLKFDTQYEKSKRDIIKEINWLHNNGYPQRAQCFPKVGDLIMFKGVGVPLNIKELYGDLVNATCEDGLRYPDSTCEALFLVTKVAYSGENQMLPLTDMDMQCIWSSESCHVKAGQYLSETTSETGTPSTSQKETDIIKEDPLITSILEHGHFTLDDIGTSTQIVVVQSSGTSCTVQLLEKSGSVWTSVRSINGVVGKNGVSANVYEGSNQTPRGVYPIGLGFGTHSAAEMSSVKIPYRVIGSNSYWCDDPDSSYYNTWVETANPDWNGASERLAKYPTAYEYAVVIEYNFDPIVPGNGSAFFLHVSSASYTAGCVGVPKADMQYIMNWLDSTKSPKILIS